MAVLGAAICVATCSEGGLTGARPFGTGLNLLPSFADDGPVVPLAAYRFEVRRLPGRELVLNQVTPVGAEGLASIELSVPLLTLTDKFEVRIAGVDAAGDTAYVAKVSDVVANAAPGTPPVSAPLVFQGADTVISSVSMGPRDTTMWVGDSAQLRATAFVNTAPRPGAFVKFISRDSTLIAIRGSNRMKAMAATGGTWIVVSTANQKRDSIRVSAIARAFPSVSRVDLGADRSITALGDTTRLAPVARDAAGAAVSGVTFTFGSLNPSVATVNASGLVTAMATGAADIVATVEGRSDTARVTVTQQPSAIVVTPPSNTFTAVNDSLRLSAQALDRRGNAIPGVTVTWSSANASVATVSDIGFVRARGNGTTNITATLGTVGGTSAVTVNQAAVSLVLTPDTLRLRTPGDTARLAPVVRDRNGVPIPGAAVTYQSANPQLATVNASGLVTEVAPGTTTITASLATLSATTVVIGANDAANGIQSIQAGTAVSLTALDDSVRVTPVALNGFGSPVPATFVFTSSNASIASVNGQGFVRAVSNGTAYVRASAGGRVDSVRVTVAQSLSSIRLVPDTMVLAVGNSGSLSATPVDRNGRAISSLTATFVSANPAVATVNASGVVTAVGDGCTTVTASIGTVTARSSIFSGRGPGCVTVAADVGSIRVTPSSPTLTVGDSLLFVADLIGPNNSTQRITPVWSTDQPGRVAVAANGMARALAAGGATLIATYQGLAGRASVSVQPAPELTAFSIAPRSFSGLTNSSFTFSVSVNATESALGIASMQAVVTGPDGSTRTCATTAPTFGSRNNGGWDCAITIPAGSATGTWHLTSIILSAATNRTFAESTLATFGSTTLDVRP